jgi:uncharacterized membrane protein YfhO
VDGQRVAAQRANVAFTAIRVPAGQHRVELRYVPVSFFVGVAVSAMTMSGWAAAAYWTRKRSARFRSRNNTGALNPSAR